MVTAAKLLYAQCWKNNEIPTVEEFPEMTKLTCFIRGKKEQKLFRNFIWTFC